MPETLMAGAGRGVIRFPQEIFPVEGFTSVHDEPNVRVLLLDAGIGASLVAMELVMENGMTVEEIRQLTAEICGIEKENVFVHLTHAITTPHNPIMMPEFMRPENAEYSGRLHKTAVLNAVREAAEQAVSAMKEVTVGCATGVCDVNINRDVLTSSGWWIGTGGTEPVNRDMTVIKFADEKNCPVAFIISYALKSCAIDNSEIKENRRSISSDVAGKACRVMEEKYNAPCLFLMSAAANHVPRKTALYDEVQSDGTVKTVDRGVKYGLELVEEYGEEMGNDAAAIAEKITTFPIQKGIKTAHEIFRWQASGRIEKKPVHSMEYPLEDKEQDIDVWILMIGEYAFVCGKPEMNQETERKILDNSPYPHTFLVTMVNGGFKYMPEAEAYDKYTWEAQSAPVAKGAAEKFAETALAMLTD